MKDDLTTRSAGILEELRRDHECIREDLDAESALLHVERLSQSTMKLAEIVVALAKRH